MRAAPYLYRYATNESDENAQAAEENLRWLSAGEGEVYAGLVDQRRRAAFLRGRILAKRLILVEYSAALRLGMAVVHPADVDIDSGLARGRRECPQVRIGGRPLPWSLSIAHTLRGVLVALGRTSAIRVGVDLVGPVALPRGFAEMWFTPAERRWLVKSEADLAPTLWGMKEAVYKAAWAERPFAPRAIEVLHHEGYGFVSNPACRLDVWRTSQGETAVVAHTLNKHFQGD